MPCSSCKCWVGQSIAHTLNHHAARQRHRKSFAALQDVVFGIASLRDPENPGAAEDLQLAGGITQDEHLAARQADRAHLAPVRLLLRTSNSPDAG